MASRQASRLLFGKNPRQTLLRASVLVAAAIVLFGFILLPVRLQGISMLPTYREGGVNFANRLAYIWHEPRRGDVVAIRMAGLHAVYVKRVVGLPGERLAILSGTVLVNGEPLVEPSVVYRAPWTLPQFTLGSDEYFVVGDNRAMPIQNHDLGRVSRDRIAGRMLF
jgi:signal peptidase I